jgi:hypothetical protein
VKRNLDFLRKATYGIVSLKWMADLKRYNRNPVVFYAHRSNDANPDFRRTSVELVH